MGGVGLVEPSPGFEGSGLGFGSVPGLAGADGEGDGLGLGLLGLGFVPPLRSGGTTPVPSGISWVPRL